MIKEIDIRRRNSLVMFNETKDIPPPSDIQFDRVYIYTKADAAYKTGRREPILVIGNVIINRIELIEILLKLSRLDQEPL